MHMERGIGRTGYLLLAFVLFALGAFGLVLGTVAFREGVALFYGLGVGTTGVALLALYVFASFRPLAPPRRVPPVPAPDAPAAPTAAPPAAQAPAPAPAPAPPPTPPAQTFEYDQFEPAATAAPDELVLPPAFREEKPPAPGQEVVAFQAASRPRAAAGSTAGPPSPARKDWPQRRQPVPKPGQAPAPPAKPSVRNELTERYTRTTPMVRSMLGADGGQAQAAKPEEHVAERAPNSMNTDFVPEGMSVGRCGQCKTLLLAPDQRPIRLACPDCGKVTLLN